MTDVAHQTFSPQSDGVVTLRPPEDSDLAILIAGRDAEFDRWLGAEAEMEVPFACIVVADHVVGWIDWDVERSWLGPDEVNVGYYLFPDVRRHGYATRAVELLLCVLANETTYGVATLLIAYGNERSLALARRAMFEQAEDIGGGAIYFKRDVRALRSR